MENTLGINVYVICTALSIFLIIFTNCELLDCIVSSPSIMDCPVYPVLKRGIEEYQHFENLSSS